MLGLQYVRKYFDTSYFNLKSFFLVFIGVFWKVIVMVMLKNNNFKVIQIKFLPTQDVVILTQWA